MFGVHPESLPWVDHFGLLLLLMTVPGWLGCAWWSLKGKWTCYFKNFIKWFILSTMHRFRFSAVTMEANIWVMNFSSILKHTELFIKLLVPIHLSRTGWPEKSSLVGGCPCFVDRSPYVVILLGRSTYLCSVFDQPGTLQHYWFPDTLPGSRRSNYCPSRPKFTSSRLCLRSICTPP